MYIGYNYNIYSIMYMDVVKITSSSAQKRFIERNDFSWLSTQYIYLTNGINGTNGISYPMSELLLNTTDWIFLFLFNMSIKLF